MSTSILYAWFWDSRISTFLAMIWVNVAYMRKSSHLAHKAIGNVQIHNPHPSLRATCLRLPAPSEARQAGSQAGDARRGAMIDNYVSLRSCRGNPPWLPLAG